MKADQYIGGDFNQRPIKTNSQVVVETTDSAGLMSLRIAIIAQAASDYRSFKLMLSRETDAHLRRDLQKQIDKLEDFFWSGWFDLLSPAPRDKVLAALDKSVEYALKNGTNRKNGVRS